MTHSLRKPCKRCGSTVGRIETKGNQDCVWCICGAYQYNAPKIETGRAERTITTIHNGIKPKTRARILMRATGRCELCGVKPKDGESLHVGHLISVKDGMKRGLTELELNNDENLCAMCQECNIGIGGETIPLRLMVSILLTRRRNFDNGHGDNQSENDTDKPA